MLFYDSSKCTGCRICEQICILSHYTETGLNYRRIKINSSWPAEESVAVCRQCPKPHCVDACPTEAISQVEDVIKIDQTKCTHCYQCFGACPFRAKVIDQEGYPIFCDTCNESYRCAQLCPTRALKRGGKR